MKVRLAYGQNGLEVEVPDSAHVIEPEPVPGLPDERAALEAALRRPIGSPPLREMLRPQDRVAVVFSDLTRPAPNERMLPPLLAEIESAGVHSRNIVLVNATGMHRPNTMEELAGMLGRDIAQRYRIVNHRAEDSGVYLGRTSFGTEVWVNSDYMAADVRILTGFIEPHVFAGFSGGPKSVLPGVVGAETIMRNHNAQMVGHPKATWGIIEGNPVHEEIREVASLTNPAFILNVSLNRHRQITGVFAGEMKAAHAAGVDFVRRTAMRPVPHLYDVVVSTNCGYPLDINLYQAVKGMCAAAEVIKPGGSIVLAAECAEGAGQTHFGAMLKMRSSPKELLEMIARPGFCMADQWGVQLQAKVLTKSRVYLHSATLGDGETRALHLEPCHDVSEMLAEMVAQHRRSGAEPSICVLPEGFATIPYVG